MVSVFRTTLLWVFALLALLLSCLAWAESGVPVRDPSLLLRAQPAKAYALSNARVLVADYNLIKKDFPQLVGKSNAEIDEWLIDRAIVMSKEQADQTVVNTKIPLKTEKQIDPITGEEKDVPIRHDAYRPHAYNRALVTKVEDGLIDGKGLGSPQPSADKGHRNGLASLGEMIREFLFQKMAQHIFDFTGIGVETVPSYAVVDLGFDIVHTNKNGEKTYDPAGAILRRAHRRYDSKAVGRTNTHLDRARAFAIETVLRIFGITTSPERPDGKSRLNIQGTPDGDVMDFGGWIVKDDFKDKAYSYYDKEWKMRPLLDPADPTYPHPDTRLRLPLDVWGYTRSGKEDVRYDNLWTAGHEWAKQYRAGHLDRAGLENNINRTLESAHFDPELRDQFRDRFKDWMNQALKITLEKDAAFGNVESEGEMRWFDNPAHAVDPDFALSLIGKDVDSDLLLNFQKQPWSENSHLMNQLLLQTEELGGSAIRSLFVREEGQPSYYSQHPDAIMELIHSGRITYLPELLMSPTFRKNKLWLQWMKELSTQEGSMESYIKFVLKDPIAKRHPSWVRNAIAHLQNKEQSDRILEILAKNPWRADPAVTRPLRDLLRDSCFSKSLRHAAE